MCDRRRDPRGKASEVGISFVAVQSILTDILGLLKVSARMLTDDQKRTRLDMSVGTYISCLAMKMILAILLSEL